MDHYATLGLSKSATEADIKTAFKKLALLHHPDRGGDTQQFSAINEAYEVLKDTKKRLEYDTKLHFEDNISKDYYYPTKNQNIKISHTITFAEQFTGKEANISYYLPSGETRHVTVKIPKGINAGQNITFSNLGDNTNPNLPPGDLILHIKVLADSVWTRDGDDVKTIKNINIIDLIVGTTCQITLPTGKTLDLVIKPGTQIGTVLNISQHGIPHIGGTFTGNILIKINADVPKITDQNIIDELNVLKKKI